MKVPKKILEQKNRKPLPGLAYNKKKLLHSNKKSVFERMGGGGEGRGCELK